MVHISTDYVFDGEKAGPYREDDPIAPLGVYGQSKAAGEAAVREAWPRHLILRTAWLYGVYGSNFLKTMLRLAAERDELNVVADQHGSPTSTADLARAILVAAAALRGGAEPWGTYHVAGSGETTWHGFASRIVEAQAPVTGSGRRSMRSRPRITRPRRAGPATRCWIARSSRRPSASARPTGRCRWTGRSRHCSARTNRTDSGYAVTSGSESMWRTIGRRFLNGLEAVKSPFVLRYPPGHFYSPVPSADEVRSACSKAQEVWLQKDCPGIDLGEDRQRAMLAEIQNLVPAVEVPEEQVAGSRYYARNAFFPAGDGIILSGMLRVFRPRKVIEVGSGFSSALMLDVNDAFLDGGTRFTFIEPYPERLQSLLTGQDEEKCRIIRDVVQRVSVDEFLVLEEGDILFIDSSHVLKAGSDVGYLLAEILPRLHRGVLVHIHDIPWPFEYAREFFEMGRAWNEAYVVRAFLQHNETFEILFFNSYVRTFFQDEVRASLPQFANSPCSSLWLRRVK
jgi:predicted O-methyltransferase YrrM